MRGVVVTVVLGCVLAGALRADAKPARPRHDFDLDDRYKPPPVCKPTSDWSKFSRCFLARAAFELVKDLPAAKLVAVDPGTRGTKRLELYVLANKAWMKTSFYAETTPTIELLAFVVLADATYRLDMGHANASWVTLDEVGTRPALLRRTFTYVCSAATCRQVLTGCEVLVHGKAVASFRGEPIWDGRMLKLRADTRNTNRYCTVPRSILVEDPA